MRQRTKFNSRANTIAATSAQKRLPDDLVVQLHFLGGELYHFDKVQLSFKIGIPKKRDSLTKGERGNTEIYFIDESLFHKGAVDNASTGEHGDISALTFQNIESGPWRLHDNNVLMRQHMQRVVRDDHRH